MNLRLTGFALDKQLYPKFAAHVERTLERPSFKKCDAFMQSFIGKMKEKLAMPKA